MQKIIIDTNVFVSALIQRGFSHQIVVAFFASTDIELCISEELFDEYYDVLTRKRFSKYPDFISNALLLLSQIQKRGIVYFPKIRVTVIKDTDDNKLLELAETAEADFLITGNTNDFTMNVYKGTQIVTPKEYWTNYLPR